MDGKFQLFCELKYVKYEKKQQNFTTFHEIHIHLQTGKLVDVMFSLRSFAFNLCFACSHKAKVGKKLAHVKEINKKKHTITTTISCKCITTELSTESSS